MSERVAHRFPDEMERRLSQVTAMVERGGQGTLYRALWDGNRHVVVKVFERSREKVHEGWEYWHLADPHRVVRLVYSQSHNNHDYEVTEWMPAGSLAQFVGRRGRPMSADEVQVVLVEIAAALDYIHDGIHCVHPNPARAWVHGDIKPGNVLVRCEEPLELCLTDFGIARVMQMTQEPATGGMTAYYAAPEMFDQQWSRAIDWWALGITVLELLQNRHPYQRDDEERSWRPEGEVRELVKTQPVPIGDGVPARWQLLIRGLTTWKRENRWSTAEVSRWLDGESPPVDRRIGPEKEAVQPFYFADQAVVTPSRLARLMADDWSAAAAVVIGRRFDDELLPWARTIDRRLGADLAELSAKYIAPRQYKIDRIVCELIVRLDRDAEPTFRGKPAHAEGLASLARAAEAGAPWARETVESLFTSASLTALAKLAGFEHLDEVDRQWQRWHDQAVFTAESLLGPRANLPELSRLTSLLLHAAVDRQQTAALAEQAHRLLTRDTRKVGWFDRLADTDETPFHALMVIFADRAMDPEQRVSETARAQVRDLAGKWRTELDEAIGRGAGGGRGPGVRVGQAARSWLPKAAADRGPRTRRHRLVAVTLSVLGCAGHLVAATILGPAFGLATGATPASTGAAALISVAGACLLGALLLPRSWFTNALLGGLSGTLAGLLIATPIGAVVSRLSGPATGWVAFVGALAIAVLSGSVLGATE